MQENHMNSKGNSFEEKESKRYLNIYCQPCLKRGLLNLPAYVNLNEFESNRYICENCSFGQTYIIALGTDFLTEKVKGVKLQNRLKMRNEEIEKDANLQNIQEKRAIDQENQNFQELQNNQINLTQDTPELEDQDQTQLPEFVKNVQINSNPQSQYSLADIDMYMENITQQYKQALDVIDKYEEMNKSHINKWRNKLKAQFQGVIGTFGNTSVGVFLKELRSLQEMTNMIKELQQSSKETQAKDKNQMNDIKERLQTKIDNTKLQSKSIYIKNWAKSQQPIEPSLSQLYAESLLAYKQQQEKIALYVETLKMSGIRNLSNLKSLYNCCKGFSDAVRILISLQHKETNRRFDFITQKFKVCSIETLYDAQMINGGYLDNRLERPPGFDVLEEQVEKKKNQDLKMKSARKEDVYLNRKIESRSLKQVSSQSCKKFSMFPIKNLDESRITSQTIGQKQPQKLFPQEISLLSSQSQRQESVILSNPNELQDKSQFKQNPKEISLSSRKNFNQETTNDKILLQQQDDLQRIRIEKLKSKKPFQSGLLNLNVMQRESVNQILRMERQRQQNSIQGSESNEIDLQNYPNETEQSCESEHSNVSKNCPFPSLRQYYQYQKGRNLFVSKLQLNQQNFQTFPPFDIYLPSVESLTIKYCPPATDPWQLLKTLKSCFKKMNQLIIEEPKLGTKEMIILIAEYFPKLKSLVFRCKNEFDWELGKLFEKKMGQLVRFEVNDGQKN